MRVTWKTNLKGGGCCGVLLTKGAQSNYCQNTEYKQHCQVRDMGEQSLAPWWMTGFISDLKGLDMDGSIAVYLCLIAQWYALMWYERANDFQAFLSLEEFDK